MKPWAAFSFVAIICLTFGAGPVAAQTTSQSVRVLDDVVGQFNSLTQRADAMGFELYGPDPSQCRHMQAVLRVDAADGTPYLLVSRNGDNSWHCPTGSERSNIYIVRMGSRDKHGERMRSNRLRRGSETTDTPPDTNDRVVRSLLFDGTSEWPNYGHPAGMQQVGNIVAVALEKPHDGNPSTKILFMDVSDPEYPVMLDNSFDPPMDGAGVLALTTCGSGRAGLPCATGHYLMMVTGGDNHELLFFESDRGDLKSPDLSWTLLYRWQKDELLGGAKWPDAAHQTLHFLRQKDGTLFLAGARSEGTVEGYFGDDYIDLYEVGFNGATIELTQRSTRHMISHPTGEGIYDPEGQEVLYGARLASFAAASGFHITPTGELLFYATEHDNDGPEGSNDRGSVKMGEWRHVDMFRPGSPALLPTLTAPDALTVDEGSSIPVTATAAAPIARPWIELFEGVGFAGRFLVVDHPDVFKDDFHNFKLLDRGFLFDPFRFDNLARSWRWFAPSSCAIRANDEPFGEPDFPGPRTRTLIGTGVRQTERDLAGVAPDAAPGDMDQAVSSAQFGLACAGYYAAQFTVRWDLDFDGAKETTGNAVTLSALNLNGPSNLELAIDTRHPIDGLEATKNIPVVVQNVSPAIGSWTLLDAAGRRIGVDVPFALINRPVRGLATFTDAGRLDTHSAEVAWGDGSVSRSFTRFEDSLGGMVGQLEAQKAYTVPGTYSPVVLVSDFEGGSGSATASLKVLSPADALKDAIAMLDALIATTSDPARAYLLAARRSLVGAGQAGTASGAQEKIDRELVVAAAAQLRNAARYLDRASALIDVAVLEAILEEIAAALAG